MRGEKTGLVIGILVIVIVLLLGVVLYTLVIQPSIGGYVIKKQLEARDIVLNSILLQIQQQGYAQIIDGQGNSIVLVPLKQEPQTGQTGQQTES